MAGDAAEAEDTPAGVRAAIPVAEDRAAVMVDTEGATEAAGTAAADMEAADVEVMEATGSATKALAITAQARRSRRRVNFPGAVRSGPRHGIGAAASSLQAPSKSRRYRALEHQRSDADGRGIRQTSRVRIHSLCQVMIFI
jgi:hypothetical protein